MSVAQQLRRIDYYQHYSSKIEDLNRLLRQQASKGHGHRKLRDLTRRTFKNGTRIARGVHDYNNIQWDPSIYRGRTFRDFREKNLPPNATTIDFNKYCCVSCNSTSGPTSFSRRRMLVGLPRLRVGGIFRPTTDDIIFEESSGRKRHKQDESKKEMEPFIIEQLDPPEYKEQSAQADETRTVPRKKCHHIAIGTSTASQANISIIGTGNKEDPLEPILKSVGSKVLEQSLLETFEEYELHVIRADIRKLTENRRNRQVKDTTEVQHQLFKAEMLQLEQNRREKELEKELEAEELIAATLYSINACNEVVAHAFDNLRRQNFLIGANHAAKIFIPWVHQNMYRHLKVSRLVINDIIKSVENQRLADDHMSTIINSMDELQRKETKQNPSMEEEEFSSFGPPPNTASTIPDTTSASEAEDGDSARV